MCSDISAWGDFIHVVVYYISVIVDSSMCKKKKSFMYSIVSSSIEHMYGCDILLH